MHAFIECRCTSSYGTVALKCSLFGVLASTSNVTHCQINFLKNGSIQNPPVYFKRQSVVETVPVGPREMI